MWIKKAKVSPSIQDIFINFLFFFPPRLEMLYSLKISAWRSVKSMYSDDIYDQSNLSGHFSKILPVPVMMEFHLSQNPEGSLV